MNQEIIREHSLEELLTAIHEVVTEPYHEWEIGIIGNGKMDDEGCLSTVVFSPNNQPAVLAAYNHFAGLGMAAKQPVLSETKYLYLFKETWEKFDKNNAIF